MGAQDFIAESTNTDVARAFDECRRSAQFEYGHGGYTGTIAEKHEYVVFTPPTPGVTADMAIDALRNNWRFEQQEEKRPDWLPQSVIDTYEDKWGPAVAVRNGDMGGWIFVGTASS